jgi:hypothetical protein
MAPRDWGTNVKSTGDLVDMMSKNMKFLAHFMADRQKVIDGTNLPDAEKEILKSQDPGKINTLLSENLPPGTRKNFDVTAHSHDIFNCTS